MFKTKPCEDLTRLKKILDSLEIIYIEYLGSRLNGYNITKGGDGVLGMQHSEESKNKISNYSKNRTEEHKEKLFESRSRSGQTRTNETKQKMSNSCKTKKKVYQYDSENNFIQEFNSIADAARSIENDSTLKTKSNRISEVCSGKKEKAYNFIWKREKIST